MHLKSDLSNVIIFQIIKLATEHYNKSENVDCEVENAVWGRKKKNLE